MDPSRETGRHTFFLIRHGETRGNITKLLLPIEEDTLTELGIAQARILGNALRDVHFTKAYSSPYIRTIQTTELILNSNENSNNLPYKIDERIREVGYGGFADGHVGILFKEFSAHLQKGFSKSEFGSKGAETFKAMRVRGQSFMEDLMKDLIEDGKPETVLIVSHGVFNAAFMEFLNDWDRVNVVNWDESCAKIMKNTTYMKFSISQQLNNNSKRELVLQKIHENSHLKESKIVVSDSLTKMAQLKDADGLSGCFQV